MQYFLTGEYQVFNLVMDVAGQSSSGMLVESFLENEELTRTVVCCHLAMDLFSHEMREEHA